MHLAIDVWVKKMSRLFSLGQILLGLRSPTAGRFYILVQIRVISELSKLLIMVCLSETTGAALVL